MVLALKLITAGVSYQDGLKKPEVPPLCLHTALQHPNAHPGAHAMWEWQLLAFVWSSVWYRTMRISQLVLPTSCVHCRSCRRISSGTG